jgi:hypothetical protein
LRREAVVGIVIILVLSTSVIFLYQFALPATDVQFRWEVEVGEEFTFDVQVLGHMDTYNYLNNASESVPFVEFNNTQIVARLVYLPNVTLVNNKTELIDVINSLKVECRFNNGTEIPVDNRHGFYPRSNRSISEIVSRAFLPVEGWDFIDSLFIDDEVSYDSHWYFSRFEDNSFFMGYWSYYFDFGYGWKANLNLTTGLPLTIEHWESDPICIGRYQVILTSVD